MKSDFIKALICLLKIKSLLTLIAGVGLLYGFLVGKISSEQFMTIVAMVFTFYFSKQTEGKGLQ